VLQTERKKEQAAGRHKTKEDRKAKLCVPHSLSAPRGHPELNLIRFCFPTSTMAGAGSDQFNFID
jgi:hypothetical protein